MKILFVCTSNIMRSPYCEFVFNRMMCDDPLLAEKVEWARSAALRWRYRHMHRQAKIALVHEGFSQEEVDSYRPRHVLIDRELFERADVIIGMTRSHLKMLPRRYRDKFSTLTEAATGVHRELRDPYWERLPQDEYEKRMAEISDYLTRYAEIIKN